MNAQPCRDYRCRVGTAERAVSDIGATGSPRCRRRRARGPRRRAPARRGKDRRRRGSRISGSRRRCCCRSGSPTTRGIGLSGPNVPFRFYDKVQTKFAQYSRCRLRGGRRARGPAGRGAPRRVRGAQRRADALVRQYRRLRRRRHDGRHVGHRRLVRADRQERASVRRRRHRRRARTAAGEPHDHRGQLLHRRALGSGRRA